MGEKKLSVCMIVKDEERYIRNCLESVQDIADEIVVVDTGSTDNTKAIANDFGAKIFDFPWVDDFSAARNFSLEKATGDWVLLLDADEELDVSSKDKVLELVNKNENVAYLVNVINFLDFTKQRTVTAKRMLLFPMRAEPYFINPIHEQLRFKKNVEIRDSTIIIKHYGYIPETVSTKKKSERNISILKKIANNSVENINVEIKAFNYYNLGVEYYRKQEYEKALQNFQKSFLLIRKKEPGFKYALIWHIVNSLINLKKFQEALKVIEDAEQLYPWYVDLVYFKGVVYYSQRSYKKAIETFMKCLEIGESLETSIFHYDGTGSYLASYGIGSCEEALGNYNKALVFYEMSLAQNYILAVIPILKL
ncbi:glycosyltransferase [Carboxydothermus hydrogenoformans]|uniref:Glycosyl transferase, group 2 family n=1 Tax=Carboxydothermus hydrogenoformans (strain ATCC BAA-161 / DSM 6008 / Z-2901) TaxID=246194 RepID=Q3ADF5_CARHZ|nr:glycosyltransferase family 2 protein [Carboxydothermus hydrogenoformans]ABB16146.1 glycosyl transferase, group 2 family [Carboxydothermus hydrogenoformans Z-2901]